MSDVGDRRALLRCSECGAEVEVLPRELHLKRSSIGLPWRAVRFARMERNAPLPGISTVICPEEKCLTRLSQRVCLSFRFHDAQGEWEGRPPIEVFFPVEDEVPEGAPVNVMKMVAVEVQQPWSGKRED